MYYIYLRGCWGCRVPGGQGVRAPATVIGFGLIPSDGAQCLEKHSLHGSQMQLATRRQVIAESEHLWGCPRLHEVSHGSFTGHKSRRQWMWMLRVRTQLSWDTRLVPTSHRVPSRPPTTYLPSVRDVFCEEGVCGTFDYSLQLLRNHSLPPSSILSARDSTNPVHWLRSCCTGSV